MLKSISLALIFVCTVSSAQDEPSKPQLIKTLLKFNACLVEEDYDSAAEFVVLPPGLKKSDLPRAFAGLLPNLELSKEGIERLAAEAKFGSAKEEFGQEKAEAFAKKARTEVDKLYGFNFETPEATAEVTAIWENGKFLLTRFDDIGKLAPAASAPPTTYAPAANAESASEGMKNLSDAVLANPKNHELRSELAMAFYENQDLISALGQLRIAAALAPTNKGYVQGLEVIYGNLESEGAFAVGQTTEEVQKVLGKPDETMAMGKDGFRHIYSFVGVDYYEGKIDDVVDLRNATEALYNPTEVVAVNLDGRNWTPGFRKKEDGFVVENWFLDGESTKSWTEQFSIERLLDVSSKGTAEELANLMIEKVKAGTANATGKILVSDEQSATIAFEIPLGESKPSIHRLVRLVKGPKDLHRIGIAIVGRPDEATQKEWFDRFQEAYLKPTK